ncbi:MAG: major facilitator superfamily 1 [Labilithrix sp.]|nr:major facilitator superfamily 1 [Labilithrix sp.]
MAGTWTQIFALQWTVLTLTDSGISLGMLSLALGLPCILLTTVGGLAADRYDRARIMVLTQTAYSVLSLVIAMAIASGSLKLWHLLACSGLSSVVTAFDIPAQQSLLAGLVDRSDLPAAVALDQFSFSVTRVIGPVIGSLLVGSVGPSAPFVFNAASGGVLVATLLLLPRSTGPGLAGPRPAGAFAGWRHIQASPALRRAFSITVCAGLLVLPLQTVLASGYVRAHLHGGPTFFAAFMAASGCAASVAALSLMLIPKARRAFATAIGVGVGGAALSLLGAVRWPYAALAIFVVVAASTTIVLGLTRIVIQEACAPEVRGRVLAAGRIIERGGVPIAALGYGFCVEKRSYAAVYFAVGLVYAANGLWIGTGESGRGNDG